MTSREHLTGSVSHAHGDKAGSPGRLADLAYTYTSRTPGGNGRDAKDKGVFAKALRRVWLEKNLVQVKEKRGFSVGN